MLVYVDHRLNKIMEIFWEYGSVIPKEFMEYMSNDEKLFVQQYKKMINDYESNLPIELDLAKDIEVPTSANIEVRVMRDCGSIITKNGSTLELKKDTIHYVCREDVENLIIQGHLKPTGL
ncbi:hypothetical protein PPERSA_04701 [Pseudocohnilembus persalinus]|uniref:GINS complex subunit 1 n=1 Tax=Pseudocohnilembus persalinus TaxID=266149 RepID=A0A0V0R4J1_PSEPJ|nr:hypothetical protein PPERSA_04701 [Pseudocohnilembus persalinus]|eukprot:KRX09395.1 hypothetical protein PPERSA_04701 [Pseudocohnilembus persalinus]